MAEIGWLAAGLRWRKEHMGRVDDLLDRGAPLTLPSSVTVRFVHPNGDHIAFEDCPVVDGFVVVTDDSQDILKKILAIPHMGPYIRNAIEEIIYAPPSNS